MLEGTHLENPRPKKRKLLPRWEHAEGMDDGEEEDDDLGHSESQSVILLSLSSRTRRLMQAQTVPESSRKAESDRRQKPSCRVPEDVKAPHVRAQRAPS